MNVNNKLAMICVISLFILPVFIIKEQVNNNYLEMVLDEEKRENCFSNLNGDANISGLSRIQTRSGYPQQDGGADNRLFQYRSMWLDGYDIVNISEVKKVVEFARENNFNCLSPLINGNYYGVYYNSSIFTKHRDVYWSFDPLMELIKEAHKFGIQVHPWYHTLYNRQILREHPEWGSVYISGSRSSYWMNPSHPQMRDLLLNATMELIRNYPLDGLKLDTIRYGSYYYSYDDYSIQKFNRSGMTNFNDFRRLQVTEIVDLLYSNIMKIRPYMWVGADVWQSYSSWHHSLFQESREWARNGIIDYLTTMSYTTSRSYFETNIKDYLQNSHGIPIVAGPYVYVPGNTYHGSVPNETVGIDLMLNQTNCALDLGTLGVCMFKYTFLYDHPNYVKALKNGPFKEVALCPFKIQNHSVSSTRWEFNTDHDRRGWRVNDMGHYYPFENVWSISDIVKPAFMSPLINISADDLNVLEISMKAESTMGEVKIYWSANDTVFNDQNMTSFPIIDTGEWNLYSFHLDDSIFWSGKVRYIRIIPTFQERTNITIDFIRLQWMPRCIQSWAYLGPFINGKDVGILDREFIMEEGSINPRIGDIDSGMVWSIFSMERDLVDYRFVYGHIEYAVTYAHVFVRSDREQDVDLRIGSSDGIKVWVNSGIKSYSSLPRRVAPDQNISSVHLNKGINSILVKLANYRNEFSYFIRLTDKDNCTIEDLEYMCDIPMPAPPLISVPSKNWTSERDIIINWSIPEVEVNPIFYEWKVDDQARVRTEDKRTILKNLSNGIHIFSIRSIDEIGTVSRSSNTTIYIDRALPEISRPKSPVNISVTGSIIWDWDLLQEPLSGITGYVITIDRWYPSGAYLDRPVDSSHGENSSFELNEHILDGYSYTIMVTAISGSGMIYSTGSERAVLSDLSPPTKPVTISLNHIPGEQMTYML
ncbi:MAG: family 10 glycosylhydrolase, partial [Thermoplasmata archaeon]|nr:family 10 glycosylhydrolase [Thermoplasmata archaeon]